MALLQYANRSREIGLLRLGLIVFGPLGCVIGQSLAGPPGLAAGLGVAEMLAYGLLAPRWPRCRRWPAFAAYFARALAFGVATAAMCSGDGAGRCSAFIRPATLPVFVAEVVLWGCLVVLPLVYVALPAGLKRAARARLIPALAGGFALTCFMRLSKIGWLFAAPSRVLLSPPRCSARCCGGAAGLLVGGARPRRFGRRRPRSAGSRWRGWRRRFRR